MKKIVSVKLKGQVLHHGEYVFHLLYLSATFIEGHGLHAMFAGGVAVFLIAGQALSGRE